MDKFCIVCGKELTGRQRKLCSARECCKKREAELGRKRYLNNREKIKEYRQNHKEEIKEKDRKYYLNNREKRLEEIKKNEKKKRKRAFERLFRIWNLRETVCHVEGCYVDDIDLLEFGHPLGNGNKHRKEVNKGHPIKSSWILNATDEEIKRWYVKPECCMCNRFHNQKGRYPIPEERKKWGGI